MTPRANKAKGYKYEVDVCTYLRPFYPDARRYGNQFGRYDRGDVGGVPDWTLQLKDAEQDRWTEWFEAAEKQSVSHSTRWWVVLRKIRRRNIDLSVFAMPLWKGLELMTHLRDLEAENESLKTRIRELEA
jgi:hypothetical protein